MRRIKCKEIFGVSVHEILDEFNERRSEFGIQDEDILSISTRGEAVRPMNIQTRKGLDTTTIAVSIFYWSEG